MPWAGCTEAGNATQVIRTITLTLESLIWEFKSAASHRSCHQDFVKPVHLVRNTTSDCSTVACFWSPVIGQGWLVLALDQRLGIVLLVVDILNQLCAKATQCSFFCPQVLLERLARFPMVFLQSLLDLLHWDLVETAALGECFGEWCGAVKG